MSMPLSPSTCALIGAGAIGAAAAGPASAIVCRRNERAGSVDHQFALSMIGGVAGLAVLLGGSHLLFNSTDVLTKNMVLAGVVGGGAAAALTTTAVGPAAFNTTDRGLNRLENATFRADHYRRLLSTAGIGAAILGVPAALLGRHSPAKFGVPAAVVGASFGVLLAAMQTTSGQDVAFRPTTDDIDQVTDELWNGVSIAASSSHAESLDVRVKPSGTTRTTDEANGARFYRAADDAGDSNRQLTKPELRAHVATFDADGDGRVEWKSEWAALHERIVS